MVNNRGPHFRQFEADETVGSWSDKEKATALILSYTSTHSPNIFSVKLKQIFAKPYSPSKTESSLLRVCSSHFQSQAFQVQSQYRL